MQAKRIQVNEGNDGVAGRTFVVLTTPDSPREETNFHNIWGSVGVEPENTDANSQGTWVLGILRKGEVVAVFTDAVINAEESNPDIIACGVSSSSNQSPFNIKVNPKTSRNIEPGGSLFLAHTTTGITAGTASTRVMLCAHVTRK